MLKKLKNWIKKPKEDENKKVNKKEMSKNKSQKEKSNDEKIVKSKVKNQNKEKFSGKSLKEEYRKEKAKKKQVAMQKRKEQEKIELKKKEEEKELKIKEAKMREEERKNLFEKRQLEKASKSKETKIQYKDEEDESFELFGYELQDLKQGMIINAEIISENNDEYICEAKDNFKEIYLPKEEVSGEVKIGETYEAVIFRHSNDDLYISQKRLSQKKQLQKFNKMFDSSEIVNGKIIGYDDQNFEVKIDEGFFALLYKNNFQLKYLENPESLIGTESKFLIKNNKARGKYSFELTRIPMLLQELEMNIEKVAVGNVIEVSKFNKNKAGIDFVYEGFEVFIPNREIAYDYIDENSDMTKYIDDTTKCEIIKCQKSKFGYNIVASIKKTLKSPFEIFVASHEVGDEVEGKIVRKEKYGIFLEVGENQRGLLHHSDFSNETSTLFKTIEIGTKMKVVVKEINSEKQQINLKNK